MSRGEKWEPISNITRMGDGSFYVGRVHLHRVEDHDGRPWVAEAPDGSILFDAANLSDIFEMAHGAAEMMRPA